jgi:hypothetical protein
VLTCAGFLKAIVAFIRIIPLEIYMGEVKSVFTLTLNAKLVDRFLRTPQYREVLERTVDSFGLECLADLRLLHSYGAFEDFRAFPSSFKCLIPC